MSFIIGLFSSTFNEVRQLHCAFDEFISIIFHLTAVSLALDLQACFHSSAVDAEDHLIFPKFVNYKL